MTDSQRKMCAFHRKAAQAYRLYGQVENAKRAEKKADEVSQPLGNRGAQAIAPERGRGGRDEDSFWFGRTPDHLPG